MRRSERILLLAAAVALNTQASRANEVDLEKVAKVKAAFLLNFIKFTSWPTEVLPPGDEPIVVVVVGTDELGAALDSTLRGREHLKHSFFIQRMPNLPSDAAERRKSMNQLCHAQAVYLSCDADLSHDEIAQLNDAAVLTVGATPDVLRTGTILSFGAGDGRVLFHHNTTARTPLQMSSKLLSLARPLN